VKQKRVKKGSEREHVRLTVKSQPTIASRISYGLS